MAHSNKSLAKVLLKVSALALTLSFVSTLAQAEVQHHKFHFNGNYLKVSILDDDLIQAEYGTGNGPATNDAITTTPMIFKKDYDGASYVNISDNQIETNEINLTFNDASGCLDVFDKSKAITMTTLCPNNLGEYWKKLSFKKNGLNQVYGLGQKLTDIYKSDANGDWAGRGGFSTADENGHSFSGIEINGQHSGGASSQLQFPIMYAAGTQGENFALLWDSPYKSTWSFSGDWWSAAGWGQVRFFLMTGDSLLDLRKDYMELTGRTPVPPKKAFGLWVSEFGYENWGEVNHTLNDLRTQEFPVDGFVLDLQWFGGYKENQGNTPMGSLSWDENNFPNPDQAIANYKADNIGLIAIEESYVGTDLSGYHDMNNQGFMTRYCGSTTPVEFNIWVGKVGVIDWTNEAGGNWWHDNRRQPNIIDKGILGHWTDLGEPERYNNSACYAGVNGDTSHGAVHNLFNWYWTKSIYDGYVRNHSQNKQRPFQLSRAGTIGTHRFGAAMWSGDIGGRLDHMAASLNAEMHMSFAGIDYYGSDIGGFWRTKTYEDTNTASGNRSEDEMYTLWFANSAWFDLPVRPHGISFAGFTVASECPDLCLNETNPAVMGNVNSNRANIRQRYELAPYYYSIAHRAYQTGEPVISPLVMYYQDDVNVKGMGNHKLIGKDILVAMVYRQFESDINVYLPKGTWINYHEAQWHDSEGQWLNNVPVWIAPEDRNRLPVFVRSGAIIPKMYVDSQTKDINGARKDGTTRNELIVQVYADEQATEFTLYEDDGKNVASYDANQRPVYDIRTTLLTQQLDGEQVNITIAGAQGSYDGEILARNNEVRLFTRELPITSVSLNGESLVQLSFADFYASADTKGWTKINDQQVIIRSGIESVSQDKNIIATATIEPMPPVANAGTDFTVNANIAFNFDGSASTDINNDIASYVWESDDFDAPLNGVSPSFTFSEFGEHVVTLTVTDARGTFSSSAVTVTVLDPEACEHQFTQVFFRGTANAWSTSPMSKAKNCTWTITQTFSGAENARFKFDINGDWSTNYGDSSANNTTGNGSLISYGHDIFVTDAGDFKITFNETNLSYSYAPVVTEVDPTAHAGSDILIYKGETAQFDASQSTDNGTIVSYVWDNGLTGVKPSMIYSNTGTFIVTLTVTDNDGSTGTDTVTVTVTERPENQPPVANAGNDFTVIEGTEFNFDGSASTDSDGEIVTYHWDFDLTGLNPSYSFATAGVYTIQLTVTDNDNATASDTVIVTVNPEPENVAPTANAGSDITVNTNTIFTFDASASTDSDGTIESITWNNGLTGENPSYSYAEAGIYTVILTVSDDDGATNTDTVIVTVTEAPSTVNVTFTCNNGNTTAGTSVYIVGNIPELGNWSVQSQDQQLSPSTYPTWQGTITLPANTSVNWKCVKAKESSFAINQWQSGSNNVVDTASSQSSSARF